MTSKETAGELRVKPGVNARLFYQSLLSGVVFDVQQLDLKNQG
ncbi:hypothetical protein HMF8227_00093 [Saliniradius amylolyticus]|uniref:Uncharacterized protein n=1 Tax=Saliniradius amylolyticus TaxID=2183582 RepID=A0A2S2DYX5_9ALTE|nr:hypothetical protein HMF8227_00093 [Saliniradius amylolyticus]